jgi:hypothetical protein
MASNTVKRILFEITVASGIRRIDRRSVSREASVPIF